MNVVWRSYEGSSWSGGERAKGQPQQRERELLSNCTARVRFNGGPFECGVKVDVLVS
jgi:hypothetical protein